MARRCTGFTLIEVLVALTALALMAGMSWQSIDALLRSQTRNEQTALGTHILHSTLQQWEADLNAAAETGVVNAVDFDGKHLRITRRDAAHPELGLRVVVWSLQSRDGQSVLTRWQSQRLQTRNELENAWQRALQAGQPRLGEIITLAASQWQVYYFRRNAWVNPLSANEQADAEALSAQATAVADAARRAAAAGTAGAAGAAGMLAPGVATNSQVGLVPDGIRLQISVLAAPALGSAVTKDWVRPTWTPSQN
jgi:general secretion pathway protein J